MLHSFAGILPTIEEGIYFTMTVLALTYMAIVGARQIVATDFAKFEAALIQRIADSMTFGTSAMQLAALCNKPTLTAFGDTRPFSSSPG